MTERVCLAAKGKTVRRALHSISFYISALIIVVFAAGGLVIFALSEANDIEPGPNGTIMFHRPALPSTSNQSTKSDKNEKADRDPDTSSDLRR